jgi:hypothetical protein
VGEEVFNGKYLNCRELDGETGLSDQFKVGVDVAYAVKKSVAAKLKAKVKGGMFQVPTITLPRNSQISCCKSQVRDKRRPEDGT